MSLWMDSIKRSNSNTIRREDILTEEKVMWYFNDEDEDFGVPVIKIKTVNNQQIVDVKGNFVFKFDSCTGGKLPFKFGKVTGYFSCSGNDLTTLEGCPTEVGDGFSCIGNNLTSLKGCPEIIHGNFDCAECNITSLEYGPKEVSGNMDCTLNNLTPGVCPFKVHGTIYSNNNIIKKKRMMMNGLISFLNLNFSTITTYEIT